MANYLAQKNHHPRDDNILLDEKSHTYTINGLDSDYMSVTKWVHSHFPSFNADIIIDKMMASDRWEKSKYFGKTKENIKALWKRNGILASRAGTKLHEDIEYFWNGDERENNSIEYTYFQEFVKHCASELLPYRTEMMIYHEEWKLAGSVDMIFEKADGTLVIYDWKRCKEIKKSNIFEYANTDCIAHLPHTNFWHYTLQLNTYKAIIEDKYGKKISGMYLVCLHPNNINESFICMKVPHLKEEMNELLSMRLKN